jgi:hypothetical protein
VLMGMCLVIEVVPVDGKEGEMTSNLWIHCHC